MLYAIMCEDVAQSLPLRQQARPNHLAALDALQNQGRLILAGPLPAVDSESPGEAGFSGSLIVAEFDCLEDAEKWARSDAYNEAGVFSSITVKPFKQVYPK